MLGNASTGGRTGRPLDRSRLRRSSVRARVLSLAFVGALVSSLVGIVAIVVVSLAARPGVAADELATLRRVALVTLIVLVLVGVVALVVSGLAVAGSITEPLRTLGRSMRRFGDGDLGARGHDAVDEVGVLSRSFNVMAETMTDRIRSLTRDAEKGVQLRVISEALDLADNEADVWRIVEHALAMLAPHTPMELLVDEGDSLRLERVAHNPTGGAPGCPVEESGGCVAIRRGQPMTFPSSGSINACPRLADRPSGPCSALCVPVTFSGQILGVIHATGADHDPPDSGLLEQLGVLAAQVGARIGALRTLELTRLQAATDTLTGLANRRSLEARLSELFRTQTPFVAAVADLDHFKQLNDTYGHEVGDRALQLFSKVLADNVRDRDLVARLGGEEFVIVLPNTPVSPAIEAIERIRNALAESVGHAGIPAFTCSYGVAHSSAATEVDAIIRIADAGLLMAKDLGRDRVVVADAELAAEVFERHPDPRPAPQ